MTLKQRLIKAMSTAIGQLNTIKPELQAEAAFDAALEVIKQFRKENK